LKFIEEVWRAAGANDVRVACDLAESFDNFLEKDLAADLLVELVGQVGPHPEAAPRCLRQLTRAARWEDAKRTVETCRGELSNDSNFVREWARYAATSNDREACLQLMAEPVHQLLRESSPELACRLFIAAGRTEEAMRILDEAVQLAVERGGPRGLLSLAEAFQGEGLLHEFEEHVRRRVPAVYEELRERLRMRR
jgi:hypothetical protein